jgi:hypothetical protein
VSLRFEDWPWGHQQTLKLCRRGYVKAAEGRLYLLSFFQVRFAQHWKAGERRTRSNGRGIETGKLLGPTRRSHGPRNEAWQL